MIIGEIQYKVSVDEEGNPLEGGTNYRIHMPPNIPAVDFWSVLVYDNQDNLLIHTDQAWPSVHSNLTKLHINEDGSVDVYFGSTAPPGKENNWIKTIPGKTWNMILRLYNPLETSIDIKWKPGNIEKFQ